MRIVNFKAVKNYRLILEDYRKNGYNPAYYHFTGNTYEKFNFAGFDVFGGCLHFLRLRG